MAGWIAVYTHDGSAVYPVGDVIGHDEDELPMLADRRVRARR